MFASEHLPSRAGFVADVPEFGFWVVMAKLRMTNAVGSTQTNLLLASLPAKNQLRLQRHLEVVALQANEHLYEVGLPIKYVHFPTTGCLISLVKVLDDSRSFDAGPVGYDGMVGVE